MTVIIPIFLIIDIYKIISCPFNSYPHDMLITIVSVANV